MLTQKEFTDMQALRRQGLTAVEIAHELGYHLASRLLGRAVTS
jgi:IS30 family transposase